MKKHTLHAEIRQIKGRKVKALRRNGLIPSTVYGRDIKSISLSIKDKDFRTTYEKTGETGLIDLTFTGSKGEETRTVLVHTVQHHPVHDTFFHVEFHEVNLKEKITTSIPLKIEGESPAVTDKLGVLLTLVQTIDVEALPADLPEHINLDASLLKAVGDEITVKQIIVPSGVTVVSDPTLTLVRVSALVQKEKIEETPIAVTPEGEEGAVPEPEIIADEKKDKTEEVEEKKNEK